MIPTNQKATQKCKGAHIRDIRLQPLIPRYCPVITLQRSVTNRNRVRISHNIWLTLIWNRLFPGRKFRISSKGVKYGVSIQGALLSYAFLLVEMLFFDHTPKGVTPAAPHTSLTFPSTLIFDVRCPLKFSHYTSSAFGNSTTPNARLWPLGGRILSPPRGGFSNPPSLPFRCPSPLDAPQLRPITSKSVLITSLPTINLPPDFLLPCALAPFS